MDNLYLAIINLLQSLFPVDYQSYTNTDGNTIVPIFWGYDNKIVPPIGNNYIIITSLLDSNMSLGVPPKYNSLTQKNTYTAIMSTLFYIDFYGDASENNARIFNSCCQNGYVNTYWRLNNHPCSAHKAKSPKNLTDIFGRDMYNNRWLVELEIFNNVVNSVNIPNFNKVDFNIKIANRL